LVSGALAASACGSDDGGSASGGSGGMAGSAATGGSGGNDASTGGMGGSAGSAGSDAGSDGPLTDGYVPNPEPGHIDFAALNPLPAGEQLLFNDWSTQPNTVSSIKTDGTSETKIFQAYRVWSMGVSGKADKIAFACGDPEQAAHYGLSLGDAIQNTWVYDAATQSAAVLSWGNVNDECHHFNAKDDFIYVCRRYDFQADFSNKGYRVGRLPVANGSIEWLGPEPPQTTLELHPLPNADDSELFYTVVEIAAGKQTRKIVKKTLPNGTPTTVRDNAGNPALSPDGARILFADYTDKGALYSMKTDGSDVVKVATRPGTEAGWSPDGSKVAYLYGETQTCNHIEIVMADGSQADSPVRVRDCGTAFITELEWILKQ